MAMPGQSDVFAPQASAARKHIVGYAGHRARPAPEDAPTRQDLYASVISGYTGHLPNAWSPVVKRQRSCPQGLRSSLRLSRVPSWEPGDASGPRWIPGFSGHKPLNWHAPPRQRGDLLRINRSRTSSSLSAVLADGKGDGQGSIRLGTPTLEQRERRRPAVALAPGSFQNSLGSEASVKLFAKTPAARYGYMAPGEGRIRESSSGFFAETLQSKIELLFDRMEANGDTRLTKEEARRFFKSFGKLSADAMFSEVDENGDEVITKDEFLGFWRQVKKNGYAEEDIEADIDDLLEGHAWVNYEDDRDVTVSKKG
eukprot:TRINITY_DN67086_c0_g1_i1.p1 TRINITY_DN67086_c0_g1~~TRINITY_DN67086_c0_g1_i1.p1  ORF type:complete len:312 (-),score=65.07 TRINITY_DN67086_c0_g1_i1:96-1031(-)